MSDHRRSARRSISFLAVTLTGLFGVAAEGRAAAPAASWKAGVSSAKITPESNMWMAGYASRTKPADGVELDLYAKALVIEDAEGTKWALVTLDLIGVPRNLRRFVAEQVKSKHGIDPARLMLNASHTHSGPELRTGRAHATDDPARHDSEAESYTERLQATLVRLVDEAAAKASPATLEYSRARCGFAMNRRTPNGKGGWNNFPNPDGPVDQAVPVLRIADADGKKEVALVFGYSCHNTTLALQQINGDYAGYAQQYLQEAHPGVVALFVNGCSGDQNPYPRGSVELARTHGRSLATAVEAALTTHRKSLTGSIRAAYREIPLAYDTLPTREQLAERRASKIKLEADHAARVLERMDRGTLAADYPYPVQVTRLGDDLTWVALGGEVVVDYSLRLKRELADPIVWVSGYSNDVMAYIPSQRVWKEGGYEAGDAMKWGTHPTRWGEGTEEQIIKAVHELRRSLDR